MELMEQSLPVLTQNLLHVSNLIQMPIEYVLNNFINQGICGAMPRHLSDLLASGLFTFFKDYMQVTNVIINNLFAKPDFPTVNISKEKKLTFLKLMIS